MLQILGFLVGNVLNVDGRIVGWTINAKIVAIKKIYLSAKNCTF